MHGLFVVANLVLPITSCRIWLTVVDNVKLKRPLPSFLKKGHPNLIVCSQGK